jgi:putative endonuclease
MTACVDTRDDWDGWTEADAATLGDQIHALGLPPEVVDALYCVLGSHWDDEGCSIAVFEAEERVGFRTAWRPSAEEDEGEGEGAAGASWDARELGSVGEEVAARYLADAGYTVLESNYRTAFGEADLVCRTEGELVFVEVKTRVGRDALPEEAVDRRKARRYRRIAEAYLGEHPSTLDLRFDVIAVNLVQAGHLQLHHFKGVDVWEG